MTATFELTDQHHVWVVLDIRQLENKNMNSLNV